MTEGFIRHLVSAIGFLLSVAVWLGGYLSGGQGWWWTGIFLLPVYFIVYALLEV